MSTALLLAITTASIVILLLLVIKAKVHPFIALLIVSLLVAIATGIPAEKIMETIMSSKGGLLGHIDIIIVLCAMLDAVIEASGDAELLAHRFSKSFSIKRTVAALTMAAFYPRHSGVFRGRLYYCYYRYFPESTALPRWRVSRR